MFNHFKTFPGFAAGLMVLSLFGVVSAVSQTTNEWTKATSGYWEESYWSLGRLPLAQDTVAFRNPNWKALAIGANTTVNYPGSLSVNNLLIQAPTYSFNQLLLNWAGLAVPLAVRSNLIIGVNGSLASHHSSLRAAYFEVNGPTTFSDGAVAAFNQIVVGHVAAAELALEDGSISCGRFVLGFGAPGTYRQTGGTLNTTNIEIGGSASFNLTGGVVSNAGLFTIRGPSSVFVAAATIQHLGKLQITNTPASASLDLEPGTNNAGAALLRFQDSRDIGWSGTLRILNFSTNHPGYGPDHIFVGTNSQGLTSGQLSRVTFVRPNSSPSNYSAAITPTGEVVPAAAQGQDFRYTTNNGTITITGYTGPGGDVIIPSTVTGLPVTAIGDFAFYQSSLTSVSIPDSVTTIGDRPFILCTSLTTITVDPDNSFYSSVGGVLFDKSQTTLILCPPGKTGSYSIPNSVTTIGSRAFDSCTGLTRVTIGNSVTSIGDLAFSYCTSLTSITIPNSVISIGTYAFFVCTSLTNAVIGNGVTSITDSAFGDCASLTSVTIPNSVKNIGTGAFSDCTSLTSVTIPNSVTEIGNYAFSDCRSLISVTIPNSVTVLGDHVFSFCDSLTTVTIPNSVTNIENYAFYGCTSLKSVTIPNSVTSLGDHAFDSCGSLTNVVIGSGVTTIGESTFDHCTSLTNVSIPNNVTTIADFAFNSCYSLISVTIGSGVTNIGNYAFYECFRLTAITVNPNNSFYSSLDGVLFNKSRITLILCPKGKAGSYTIPNSVTSIANEAFDSCASLTSVIIPNSVTLIGDSAFRWCTGLTNIIIPNSVTSIGNSAFSFCTGLTGITLPNNLTTIPYEAFSFCSSLTSVTIPPSVTTIGAGVFAYCTSLISVIIPTSVTSIGDLAFYHCTSLTAITVNPNNSFYSSLDGVLFNKAQTTLLLCPVGKVGGFTIPGSVTSIAGSAFSDCTGLTSVTMPNSITTIGDSAFYNCTNLTSITIPNSVTTIGNYAFYQCTGLTNAVLGGSLTYIGDYAFINCISLTSVTLPNSVVGIGTSAFSGCTGLTKVTIPNGVTTLGNGAFSSCTNLTTVTIGSSLTTIGNYTFSGCTSLTSITLPDTITTIGDSAFYNCTSLASFTIPKNVTTIGESAFYNCTSLTSVSVPNSVTNIGSYAFYSCTNLTSVSIGNGITTIEYGVFQNCTSLTAITVDPGNPFYSSLDGVLFNKARTTLVLCPQGKRGSYTIPNSVTTIGDSAFYNCTSLTSVTIPNTVTSIGQDGFSSCAGLTTITVGPANSIYSSLDGVLFNKAQDTLILYPQGKAGSYTIPDGVTSIGNSAFLNCRNLTGVTIPNTITIIGDTAFAGCTSLTSVIIPNGVNSIGSAAFDHCINLTQITIPNSVTAIGDWAFTECYSLTSITIPSSVTTIGAWAFSYCFSLSAVYFEGNAPRVGSYVFGFYDMGQSTPTIYYLPGTTGWGPTFADRPTALWLPKVDANPATFGVHTNRFGFIISWADARTVIVEARTNLAKGTWLPLSTNTLTDGSFYFSDPQWTNYQSRFYRLHAP